MLREGQTIKGGKYQLLSLLGKGAQGEVWAARQLGLGQFAKDVVLKFVVIDGVSRAKVRAMLLREARLCAGLHHPAIVSILDADEDDDGRVFIAMERIFGMDLAHFAARYVALKKAPMPWEIVCYMMARVCRGLHFAHTQKRPDGGSFAIVHRDLKPHNLLVSEQGEMKIIDFGIAKAHHSLRKTKTDSIKGTPAYMSPEQIAVRGVDGRSDLFSMGVILYELCSGELPFVAPKMYSILYKIMNEDPIPLKELVPEIPTQLNAIVMRLLEKSPDARFDSARALQDALGKLLVSQQIYVGEDDVAALYEEIRHIDLDPTSHDRGPQSGVDAADELSDTPSFSLPPGTLGPEDELFATPVGAVLPTPQTGVEVGLDERPSRAPAPKWLSHTMPLPDELEDDPDGQDLSALHIEMEHTNDEGERDPAHHPSEGDALSDEVPGKARQPLNEPKADASADARGPSIPLPTVSTSDEALDAVSGSGGEELPVAEQASEVDGAGEVVHPTATPRVAVVSQDHLSATDAGQSRWMIGAGVLGVLFAGVLCGALMVRHVGLFSARTGRAKAPGVHGVDDGAATRSAPHRSVARVSPRQRDVAVRAPRRVVPGHRNVAVAGPITSRRPSPKRGVTARPAVVRRSVARRGVGLVPSRRRHPHHRTPKANSLATIAFSISPKMELFEEANGERRLIGRQIGQKRLRRKPGRYCFLAFSKRHIVSHSFCLKARSGRRVRFVRRFSFGAVQLISNKKGLVFLKLFGQIGITGQSLRLPVGKHRLKVLLADNPLAHRIVEISIRPGSQLLRRRISFR